MGLNLFQSTENTKKVTELVVLVVVLVGVRVFGDRRRTHHESKAARVPGATPPHASPPRDSETGDDLSKGLIKAQIGAVTRAWTVKMIPQKGLLRCRSFKVGNIILDFWQIF